MTIVTTVLLLPNILLSAGLHPVPEVGILRQFPGERITRPQRLLRSLSHCLTSFIIIPVYIFFVNFSFREEYSVNSGEIARNDGIYT